MIALGAILEFTSPEEGLISVEHIKMMIVTILSQQHRILKTYLVMESANYLLLNTHISSQSIWLSASPVAFVLVFIGVFSGLQRNIKKKKLKIYEE